MTEWLNRTELNWSPSQWTALDSGTIYGFFSMYQWHSEYWYEHCEHCEHSLTMAIVDLLGFLPENYKLLEKTAYLFFPQHIMEFIFFKFMLVSHASNLGWRGRWEGGSGWGTHVNSWLFHSNVWQNSLEIKKKRIPIVYYRFSLCEGSFFSIPWTVGH